MFLWNCGSRNCNIACYFIAHPTCSSSPCPFGFPQLSLLSLLNLPWRAGKAGAAALCCLSDCCGVVFVQGKVTEQKDHQAGEGGGGSVPLHSVLVAMGGKSLVCMTGFQGVMTFCLGSFRGWIECLYEIRGAGECWDNPEAEQSLQGWVCGCSGWGVCVMSGFGSVEVLLGCLNSVDWDP